MSIYGENSAIWILEIKHSTVETNWRRVGPKMSTRLERVIEASREYIGGDCNVQARNILDGRTIDLKAL